MNKNKLFSFLFIVFSFLLPTLIYRAVSIKSIFAGQTLSATISAPVGGEVLRVGTTFSIKWVNNGDINRVNIYLIHSQTGTKSGIALNVPNTNIYPTQNILNWYINEAKIYPPFPSGFNLPVKFYIQLDGYNSQVGSSMFVTTKSKEFSIIGGGTTFPNPTPTKKPTPTVKPTATPTKKPTPTPTPKPVINRPPVISNKVFYFAKKNKGFVFNIPITDREGDQITAKIIGKMPKGVVSWCNYGPYGFGCYFSGLTSKIGTFRFRIEAVDARGAKSVDYSYLIVTVR